MPFCLIGLGANEGPRQQTLDQAVERLRGEPGVRVLAQSRFFSTPAAGGPANQPAYLNAALLVDTALGPEALLAVLMRIEQQLGRRRGERWGPRAIDLDLLLYGEQVLQTPSLVLPHPRMAWRRFVLEPAAEVAPQMIHPTTGWTIARLLNHLNTAAPYVAIAGPIGVGKTRLAEAVARQVGAKLLREELDLPQLEAFYGDPTGTGWSTEIQFLRQRARLLAGNLPPWTERPRLVVSDFWFDQSLAFGDVWLKPDQATAFAGLWHQAWPSVVRPKLVVLLDAPAQRLLQRIAKRGRPGEQRLGIERLEQLRSALRARASAANVGPLLYLDEEDFDARLREVLGAIEAL